MTPATAAPPHAPPATDTVGIRPFAFTIAEAELADLRDRIKATRWPEREPVGDFSQGVPLATIQELARYWADEYDWRTCEARLKALPHFITEIDGLDIHFIHVRSGHENALPLIVTHGWPGSVIEQLKLVGPLTDPEAHGASASDAFDLVIPSLPGFGFSAKPTAPGWDPGRIARAWIELMRRLGYSRFVAQGGDWGAMIVDLMGLEAPPELLGIHTSTPAAVPPEVDLAAFTRSSPPAGLTAEETGAFDRIAAFYSKGLAYALEMGNRPQTLYGLVDSPVGLAAWILDHDDRSLELIARVFDGQDEGLTRDDVLDNITLYWLTSTAVSAARIYRENTLPFFTPKHVTIPVAVSVFPDEIYTVSRRWAETAYPRLLHFSRHDRGGHYAAWEQPELLSEDLRVSFRPLR